MTLKEFKDYPNTETPIDAENLNFNFNELGKLQNAITVGLAADFVQSTGSAVKIPIDTILCKLGDKLTFSSSDNSIVIGEGINYVEVSGHIMQKSSHSNLCGLYISKNAMSLNSAVAVSFSQINTVNVMTCTAISPTIVKVNPGDKFYLAGYSDQNGKTVTYTPYNGKSNYLTVKVIS